MQHLFIDLAAGVWWVYVVCLLVAGASAWYTYTRVVPEQSQSTLVLLRALRTLGLACLLLLLFEPIVRLIQSERVTPRVALLIDESRSMPRLAKLDSAALRRELSSISSALSEDFDVDVYGFSDVLREVGRIEDVRTSGYRTNITSALTALGNRSLERRIGSIVIVTDGQHNGSDNPLRVAEQLGIGVYSVGVGDTVMPRDAALNRLLVAGIGVVGESMPVTIDLESQRVPDGQYELIVEDNGAKVQTERVTIRAGVDRQTMTLAWKPTQEGVRKLALTLRPIAGEVSTANNRVQAFVDVRAYKRTVVLIAGSPSPDVTFIKASLLRDPSVRVTTFTQRQGAEFYEGTPTKADLTNVESVMLIGYPTSSSSASVTEVIATACASGTALFFMPSVQVDYQRLGSLAQVLPFRVTSSRPQEFLVTPEVNGGRASDPIMKLSGGDGDATMWTALPPCYRTETFVEPTAGAQVLATMRVGNASLDEPLIMKRDDGRTRSLAVLGYGIYRWRLLGSAPQQSRGGSPVDVLDAFMANSLSWLRVRDTERRIVVSATQTFYATGEPVGFVASVQDESFAAIDDAEVLVTMSTPQGEQQRVLAQQGSGRYSVNVGSLPPGDYAYNGTVRRRGVVLAIRRGRFTVGDMNIEDAALIRNVPLLTSLAQRTGALAVGREYIDSLKQALLQDPRMREVVTTRDREYPVYHLPWLIIIALASFSAEWALRKRRGLV